jgi:pSer/pThr/pTyr-binding forkhead associated (FHA) protein
MENQGFNMGLGGVQAKAGLIIPFSVWDDNPMALQLKGLNGPLKDRVFPLKPDMTLGRGETADIVIEDAKASSLHARIRHEEGGIWRLEDNNSKNGTRVEGERISSMALQPGLIFFISEQAFEVVKETPAEPDKKKRFWYDVLAEFLEHNAGAAKDRAVPVSPLKPALVLDFQRGVQVNSRWVIGYGPRKIGSGSLDLPIWEPGAPSVCFEIFPSPDGLVFRTRHPEIVRINGQGVDSHVLNVGDTIQILDTIMEVDFAE